MNDLNLTTAERSAKRFANVRARCALAGITLHKIDGDFGMPVYIATRWALTRSFDDLGQVEDWLARVTGKPVEAAA